MVDTLHIYHLIERECCEVSVMGGAGSDQGVYGTAANLMRDTQKLKESKPTTYPCCHQCVT
jgi:hypothetical protein